MTTRRYTKDDVETHGGHPAVNVKTYNFPRASEVELRFGCDEATADKALEYAWNAAVERFWEDIGETVEYVLGKGTRWTAAGRSSGWLEVYSLPEIGDWDAIALAKWRKFERLVKNEVAFVTSVDMVLDDIEANEWFKPLSSQYNWIDTADGPKCLADMRAEAIESGYGPVVSKC